MMKWQIILNYTGGWSLRKWLEKWPVITTQVWRSGSVSTAVKPLPFMYKFLALQNPPKLGEVVAEKMFFCVLALPLFVLGFISDSAMIKLRAPNAKPEHQSSWDISLPPSMFSSLGDAHLVVLAAYSWCYAQRIMWGARVWTQAVHVQGPASWLLLLYPK